MRVSHILSHVSAQHAGVPIATAKMALAQKNLGVDISFWTTGDAIDKLDLATKGIPANVYSRSWPHGWRYAPNLANGLRQSIDKIDLLHIHEVWQYPAIMAARISKKNFKPYIWAPRASLEPWRMKQKGWKKNIYFSLFGDYLMRNAACMHAVSAAETEGFRMLGYRGPVAVIPNGITLEEFRELPESSIADEIWPVLKNRKVVLFLSRISPEKGLDQLVPAWGDIIRSHPEQDLLLVLAGPDDRGYQKVIHDMVISHNLARHILLPGMVSGIDKLALISRSNIYVLPSYSEGFSNSLLENLAAGTPALITPGCNFPEAVTAGAAICVDPNKKAIVEGLSELIDMPESGLFEMGNKGRNLVLGSYTWEVAARRLVTVYQAILDETEIPLYPEPSSVGVVGSPL